MFAKLNVHPGYVADDTGDKPGDKSNKSLNTFVLDWSVRSSPFITLRKRK
jgi:hypothetical protein